MKPHLALILASMISAAQAQAAWKCFDLNALKRFLVASSLQDAVDPCCREVKALLPWRSSIEEFSAKDPYAFGPGGRLPAARLTFSPPSTMRAGEIPFRELEVPNQSIEARLNLFIQKFAPNASTEFAGEGAVSKVWYFAENPPPGLDSAELAKWTRERARSVVKIRKLQPDGYPSPRTDWMANVLRRDLGVYELARQLAAGARLRDQPFVRVATLRSTPEQLRNGILVQEAVSGPSAFELNEALHALTASVRPEKTILDRAWNTLAHAGFDPADLQAQESLREKLVALEDFYRLTHDNALKFQRENQMPPVGNTPRNAPEKSEPIPIGLDFSHGRNVVWDVKTRMWVLTDW